MAALVVGFVHPQARTMPPAHAASCGCNGLYVQCPVSIVSGPAQVAVMLEEHQHTSSMQASISVQNAVALVACNGGNTGMPSRPQLLSCG